MRFFGVFVFAVLFMGCGKEKMPVVWERQDSGTAFNLSAIYFLDAQRGVAVGGNTWYQGVSLITTDGGRHWKADSLTNKQLFALDFDQEGEGVAAGIDGYVFSRGFQDVQWQFYRYPVWRFYRGVSHRPYGTLLAGGDGYKNGIIARLDAQFQFDTFIEMAEEMNAVSFVTDQTAIAAGYGLVLRSEDGGRTWFPLPVGGDHFRGIHFPTEETGYIVGYAGTILKTTDGGRSWEKLRDGGNIWVPNMPFRAVFFVDEETGYLAGDGGLVWKTTNGGEDWMQLEDLPEIDFYDIHVVGNEGWLAGEGGAIIHFQE
ncbi:MAG: YCF48-related protein [Saprospiraceae bacterium]